MADDLERLGREVDASALPMVVVDREGVVLLANAAMWSFTGFSADDVVGDFVEALLPSSLRWGHARYRMGFFAEPSDREMATGMTVVVRCQDGSEVAIEGITLRADAVDGVTVAVATLRFLP
jgi:PAS domain S-box-containing protein